MTDIEESFKKIFNAHYLIIIKKNREYFANGQVYDKLIFGCTFGFSITFSADECWIQPYMDIRVLGIYARSQLLLSRLFSAASFTVL